MHTSIRMLFEFVRNPCQRIYLCFSLRIDRTKVYFVRCRRVAFSWIIFKTWVLGINGRKKRKRNRRPFPNDKRLSVPLGFVSRRTDAMKIIAKNKNKYHLQRRFLSLLLYRFVYDCQTRLNSVVAWYYDDNNNNNNNRVHARTGRAEHHNEILREIRKNTYVKGLAYSTNDATRNELTI